MRKLINRAGFAALLVVAFQTGDALAQFGGRGGGGRGGDPAQRIQWMLGMFDRVANGRASVPVSEFTRPGFLQASLSQYVKDKGISNGEVTKDQFQEAVQAFMAQRSGGQPGAGGQPGPGGRPGMDMTNPAVVQKMAQFNFNLMDVNKDGRLSADEIPPALHDKLMAFDKNGDGVIDLEEFTAYQLSQAQAAKSTQEQHWETETVTPEGELKRPVVYRAGKLPKALPAWFEKFDTDKDGQVSLYEWRMANQDVSKFKDLDRNNDGFLTVEEVLQYERVAKAKSRGESNGTQVASAKQRPTVTDPGPFPARGPGMFPGGGRGFPGGPGMFRKSRAQVEQ
jgi:Ca2+-binding EF-hand superfamily protein